VIDGAAAKKVNYKKVKNNDKKNNGGGKGVGGGKGKGKGKGEGKGEVGGGGGKGEGKGEVGGGGKGGVGGGKGGGGKGKGLGGLYMNFYGESCENLEQTVQDITWAKVQADATMAPKLLRLHYHDCFVRSKRPLWPVYTGRRDGRVSVASEASRDLPAGSSNFTTLSKLFARFRLDDTDLVTLSGAHTIGVTHCTFIFRRLYNFTGKGDTDPAFDPVFAKELKKRCPPRASILPISVDLDSHSALSFDSNYYNSISTNKGVLSSDAALLTNPASAALVAKFKNFNNFIEAFAKSMVKMGSLNVLTGKKGEIRQNCRVINK
ncbi:hypothetical protein F8388_013006, partial [Cannabis sativa]